jgi:hypothetical protein
MAVGLQAVHKTGSTVYQQYSDTLTCSSGRRVNLPVGMAVGLLNSRQYKWHAVQVFSGTIVHNSSPRSDMASSSGRWLHSPVGMAVGLLNSRQYK